MNDDDDDVTATSGGESLGLVTLLHKQRAEKLLSLAARALCSLLTLARAPTRASFPL